MALITCPECGKRISDKATYCIGCGCPMDVIQKQSMVSRYERQCLPEKFRHSNTEVCATAPPMSQSVVISRNDAIQPAKTTVRKFLYPEYTEEYVKSLFSSIKFYERGKEYYTSGRVSKIETIKTRTMYAAFVRGTNVYRCNVEFSADKLKKFTCSCPAYTSYYGPCKHIAAMLLKIRDEHLAEKNRTPSCVAQTKRTIVPTAQTRKETAPSVEEKELAYGDAIAKFSLRNSDGLWHIERYTGNEVEVVIPAKIAGKPVVSIEKRAFGGNKAITSVTIPGTIEVISEGAFGGCTALREVKMGEGVQEIGSWAFCNCVALQQVHIPRSVTKMGKIAFSGSNTTKIYVYWDEKPKNWSPQWINSCTNVYWNGKAKTLHSYTNLYGYMPSERDWEVEVKRFLEDEDAERESWAKYFQSHDDVYDQ